MNKHGKRDERRNAIKGVKPVQTEIAHHHFGCLFGWLRFLSPCYPFLRSHIHITKSLGHLSNIRKCVAQKVVNLSISLGCNQVLFRHVIPPFARIQVTWSLCWAQTAVTLCILVSMCASATACASAMVEGCHPIPEEEEKGRRTRGGGAAAVGGGGGGR